jgi:hypothetical protein
VQRRIGEIDEGRLPIFTFFETIVERMTLVRIMELAAPEAIRAALLKKEDL